MNEAGVVVELMWLDATRYPAADERPTVGTLEWIQYQLDTASSVDDVVRNAEQVRLAGGVPLHFLIADAKGNVAAIEFLGGKLVVHRGDTLPVPALANDPYTDSFAAMQRGATDRFARAANGLGTATTIDGAFTLLDRVRQPSTRWSIVYDIPKRTVHWRTANNRERRSAALSSFDFRCTTPVRVLDVDEGRGDVARLFRDYSTAGNLALLERSVRNTSFLRDTPKAAVEKDARWPERSACATP